jgi:hypothetical protein
VFLVIYILRSTNRVTWHIDFVILPIWVFILFAGILGFASLVAGCCKKKPHTRRKHFAGGTVLLLAALLLLPFMLMIEMKLLAHPLPWLVIFVPLWVADGIAFIVGIILLLFTLGSASSSTFSIPQVLCFLLSMPGVAAFKAMLALALDESDAVRDFTYNELMAPLWIVLALLLLCGLSMTFRKRPHGPVDSEETIYTYHSPTVSGRLHSPTGAATHSTGATMYGSGDTPTPAQQV